MRKATITGAGRLAAVGGVFLALAVASQAAVAGASAIAYGSDKSWGWATKPTQKEADQTALRLCNEGTKKKDCELDKTKAIARAEGGGVTGYGRSAASLADARHKAVKACGNNECKVTLEVTKPGFYSLAKSEPDKDGGAAYHIAHEFEDSDEADRVALSKCADQAGRKCNVVWSGAIAGVYKTAAAAPARQPAPAVAEKSCRPTTPTVRCSSQCTNGSCIVTYENGCRMRVQVRPQYDAFNNQWTYPAPSC